MIPKLKAFSPKHGKVFDIKSLNGALNTAMGVDRGGIEQNVLLDGDALIWMWPSGLYDKNGEEIYSGQLVRFVDSGIYAPVIFDRGMFKVILPDALVSLNNAFFHVEVDGNGFEHADRLPPALRLKSPFEVIGHGV